MARKPMVTRTLMTTKATVLCMDIEAAEPFNKEVTLPRTYKDDKKLMAAVESVINTETVKAVHVVHVETVETLYGMDETEFIAHATILPPRSVSANEAEA